MVCSLRLDCQSMFILWRDPFLGYYRLAFMCDIYIYIPFNHSNLLLINYSGPDVGRERYRTSTPRRVDPIPYQE